MGGDASGLNGVGLYANWELDLWGRVRSARAATEATYGSAVADAEYARQSVAALVAKAYFLAVEASLQLRLARRDGRNVAATGHVCRTASAHRQGRWLRRGDCAWQSRDLARHRREADAVARAGTACTRSAGRTLSRGGCGGRNAAGAAAGASPGWPAVGTAGTASGRRRSRQACRRCVLRRPGSQGGSAAEHLADGIGQRHLQRPVRAQEQRQPDVECGRKPAATGLQCGCAADTGPHPHGGAEAVDCRVRADRGPRVRGSRGRVVGRVCSKPARGCPCPCGRGEPDRAGVLRSSASRSAPATCGRSRSSNSRYSGRRPRCCECSPSDSSSESICTWPLGADSKRHRRRRRSRKRRSES